MSGWTARYVRWAIAGDFASALVAFLVALFVRFGDPSGRTWPYVALTFGMPFLWIAAMGLARAYEPRFTGAGSDEFRRVLNAGFSITASVAIASYATKTDVARGYVIVALPLATFLTLCARYTLRRQLHALRMRGRCMRRVVAVGHRTAARDLVKQLRREPYHGMNVVAVCLPEDQYDTDASAIDGVPVVGYFGDVALAVGQASADTVAVLACPEMNGSALRRLAWQLEKTDTDLCVAPALMEVAGPRTSIRAVAGLPLLYVDHPELAGMRQLVKSMFDKVMAAGALLFLAPVFLVIVALIRLTSPGGALFCQTRVGRDGREFTVLKFRTMVVDAESRKADLSVINDTAGAGGVLFKIKNDPRITVVGSILRKFSIDELPQLINVLLGDMSLVGPRPPLPEEVAKYGDDVRRRLVVKPGMTGLWQVSGRSDLTWEESVRLDLRYVENWSLAMDLQILWKTWSAVFSGSGAY